MVNGYVESPALQECLNQILLAANNYIETERPIEKNLILNSSETRLYYSKDWEGQILKTMSVFYECFWGGYDTKRGRMIPFLDKLNLSVKSYAIDFKDNINKYYKYFADRAEGKSDITDPVAREVRRFLSDWQEIVHFLDVMRKNHKIKDAILYWFSPLAFQDLFQDRPYLKKPFKNLLNLEYRFNGKIPFQALAKLAQLPPGSVESKDVEWEAQKWIEEINGDKNIRVRFLGKALSELVTAFGSDKTLQLKLRFDWLIVNLSERKCKVFDQIDSKHISKYTHAEKLQEQVKKGLKELKPDMVETLTPARVEKCFARLFYQFREKMKNIEVGSHLSDLKEKVSLIKDNQKIETELQKISDDVNKLIRELKKQVLENDFEKFVDAIGDGTGLDLLPMNLGGNQEEVNQKNDIFKTLSLEEVASKGLNQVLSEMINQVISAIIEEVLNKSFAAFQKKMIEEFSGKTLTQLKESDNERFKVFEIKDSNKIVMVANNKLDLIRRFAPSSWLFPPIDVYVKDPKGSWVIAERVISLKGRKFTCDHYRLTKDQGKDITEQKIARQLAGQIKHHMDPTNGRGFAKHPIHNTYKQIYLSKDKASPSGGSILDDLVLDKHGDVKIDKLYVRDDKMTEASFSKFERLCAELSNGNQWVFSYMMNVSGLDSHPRAKVLRSLLMNNLNSNYEVKSLPKNYPSDSLSQEAKLLISAAKECVSECYGEVTSKKPDLSNNREQILKLIKNLIIKYYTLSGAAGTFPSNIRSLVVGEILGNPLPFNGVSEAQSNFYRQELCDIEEKEQWFEKISK